MFVKRYLFGVALFANILLIVTGLQYKCVSDSYGTLEGNTVDVQASYPPSIVGIPNACPKLGVTAKACSVDDHLTLEILNLDQLKVTSYNPVIINIRLYCDNFLSQVEDQGRNATNAAGIDQEIALAEPNAAKIAQDDTEVKQRANTAQDIINRVKFGAVRAQDNVNKAQLGVQKAQKDLAEAFIGEDEDPLRIYKAEHSIIKAQRRIEKAQRNVDKAYKRAEEAQKRVDNVQDA